MPAVRGGAQNLHFLTCRLTRLLHLLPRDLQPVAVRLVAEVLPGDGQQFRIAAGCVIHRRHIDPIERFWMVLLQVVLQELAHIALAVAMADQQHAISFQNPCADFVKISEVQWGPLSGHVAVVAMAQALMAAPEAMGPEFGGVQLSSSRHHSRAPL